MTSQQTQLTPLDEVIKDFSDLPLRTIVEVGVLKLSSPVTSAVRDAQLTHLVYASFPEKGELSEVVPVAMVEVENSYRTLKSALEKMKFEVLQGKYQYP